MTDQDDELKDLFRQKNLENAFSPDEQNWEKMSTFLKDEREGKRRLFIYLSLLLLSLGLGSLWFFNEQKNPDILALKPQEATAKTTPPVNNTQQPVPAIAASKSAKPEQEVIVHEQLKRQPIADKEPETSAPETQQPTTKQTKSDPIQQKQKTHTPIPVKMEMPVVEKKKVNQPEKETTPLVSSSFNPGKQVAAEGSLDPEQLQPKEKKASVVKDKDASKTKNQESNNEELATPAAPLQAELSSPGADHKTLEPVQNTPQENSAASPGALTKDQQDVITTDVLAMTTVTLPVEMRDLTINPVIQPRDSIIPKAPATHRIFLEAGSNYLLGWKTNNKTEANGFNPMVGIQYYHEASRKIGLSIGLHYSTINNLGSTSHTSTTTRLKFGEETDVTVISALKMHYLLMPLKLSYKLSRKDFVCIGYTIGYLLNVESKVEEYSTKQDRSTTPVVSRSMGYTSGFNPYDGQITLSYRRRLYKEFYVNGEFFYGLRDLKDNAIYASNEFERTCGFRLSLSINLWKK